MKKLTRDQIIYDADFANGANDVYFILTNDEKGNSNIEGLFISEYLYGDGIKGEHIMFELKDDPLSAASEYLKVRDFLLKERHKYKYLMVVIKDQEDSHDGLEYQPIIGNCPIFNSHIEENVKKWYHNLIIKEGDIDEQIVFLNNRSIAFTKMYVDSLDPNNYPDGPDENSKYHFSFV